MYNLNSYGGQSFALASVDQTAKQSVSLRIQVRPRSQTKGPERPGTKLKTESETEERHTRHMPVGRVRLARFARVRLLGYALPISLLILRKKEKPNGCFAVYGVSSVVERPSTVSKRLAIGRNF